jgi:phosphoserine phosphatase RsbU/P
VKKIVMATLLLALLACVGLHAQTFSLRSGLQRVTSLDGMWRFHIGDDPAWASPDFNDSQWPLLRSDKTWTEQGYPPVSGYAWYRFKVELPGDGKPVDLFLTDIANGYQVYADGKLIGSAGSSEATKDPTFSSYHATFHLPSGAGGPHLVSIALRVWAYKPIASWAGAGPLDSGNRVGDADLLAKQLHLVESARAVQSLNDFAYGLFAALIGIAILALYLLCPADKEYLWFAILLLGDSADSALHQMLVQGSIPFPLYRALGLTADAISEIAALAFFAIILRKRKSLLWWIACVAVALSPLTAALIYFQWTSIGISYAIGAACFLPAYGWVIASLLFSAIRGDISARLLIVPVILFNAVDMLDYINLITWQLKIPNVPTLNVQLFTYPYPVALSDVINYAFMLALLIFLVRRFSLARKEEERLAGEFEAAKTVQALLIPAVPPQTPGFEVESVYLPASEVGGDFFQVLTADDCSLLIVVGDVSGKGLKAAMTVSTIIGALRNYDGREPADVLSHLNRVLHGHVNGFVTCAAAFITSDGDVTVANAGHIAPYRNGLEMPVESGLPLGIVADSAYDEVREHLDPGERLTFVSDGVVEAKNERRELFGFERTRKISDQPARMICEEARRFGQEDDISVVCVKRAAVLAQVSA